MTINPREAMVLSFVVEAGALAAIADEDIGRLSRQFRMDPTRVRRMADRIDGEIRSAGSTLNSCEPRMPEAERCSRCGGLDVRLMRDGSVRCGALDCAARLGTWRPSAADGPTGDGASDLATLARMPADGRTGDG